MGEEASQGITRRDLLRRGAVLGGAVVWTTPMVQTLGMGRAFAQTASPVGGKDISYIGIKVECPGEDSWWIKWEDGNWEDMPGAAPECEDKENLPQGVSGSDKGFGLNPGATSACKELHIPETYSDCTVTVWVKAGSSGSTSDPCNTYTFSGADIPGTHTICSSAI